MHSTEPCSESTNKIDSALCEVFFECTGRGGESDTTKHVHWMGICLFMLGRS
jgi:hypothetical protein